MVLRGQLVVSMMGLRRSVRRMVGLRLVVLIGRMICLLRSIFMSLFVWIVLIGLVRCLVWVIGLHVRGLVIVILCLLSRRMVVMSGGCLSVMVMCGLVLRVGVLVLLFRSLSVLSVLRVIRVR